MQLFQLKLLKMLKMGSNHILKYGTMHTDSIITNNKKNAAKFF